VIESLRSTPRLRSNSHARYVLGTALTFHAAFQYSRVRDSQTAQNTQTGLCDCPDKSGSSNSAPTNRAETVTETASKIALPATERRIVEMPVRPKNADVWTREHLIRLGVPRPGTSVLKAVRWERKEADAGMTESTRALKRLGQ
jgi:hypothetical protein